MLQHLKSKYWWRQCKDFFVPWSPSCLNKAHLGQWFCYQPPCLILTLLNASKEKRSPCLKNLLKHLLELNILSTKQCDVITTEFKKFLDVEVKTVQRESVIFSQKDDRLDDCYFKVANISKDKDLSFVVKLIFTLSHGQASVEHVFS